MAILTEQQKKQRNLIGVAGAFIMLSIAVLYFGFLRKDEIVVSTTVVSGVEIFSNVREIQLDVDLLEDVRFKSLTPYDRISIREESGRGNPFRPY